jgi:hypothetical protein
MTQNTMTSSRTPLKRAEATLGPTELHQERFCEDADPHERGSAPQDPLRTGHDRSPEPLAT